MPKLTPDDPHDTPGIDFYLCHRNSPSGCKNGDPDHNLTAMAEGVELAREIFKGVPEPIGPLTEQDPGAAVNTLPEFKQAIKNQNFSHHATSTDAFGADDDTIACLDSRFGLGGVESLRVVDAWAFGHFPAFQGPFQLYQFI